MAESLGDAAQTRAIVQQAGEAAAELAVAKYAASHPTATIKAEIPAPLKWASGIVAALFAMGVGAVASWLVSTTNETQLAVGRIEERIKYIGDDLERRIVRLEQDKDEK
jgi:hypothetical protein